MKLSLVVPCYNEEAALPITTGKLKSCLDALIEARKIEADSNVWLVDDGSRDGTWGLIEGLATSPPFVGLKLARNFGHQAALLAGMFAADGDAVISLDADLQDDVTCIARMVDAHLAGHQVVYGVRARRDNDTWFKRISARAYYRLLHLMGVEIVPDHADFRLLGRKALDALQEFGEVNLFLRGVVPHLGFRSCAVSYDRAARVAGESKYPMRRMLALAIDGITSFSGTPLRIVAALGALVFVLTLFASAWVLAVRLGTDKAIPGWASTVLPMFALGGVQLLSLGVIGEYVAKIYLETKRRPRYLIEKVVRGPGG